MVKLISFHEEKNWCKLKGDWTHDPEDHIWKEKNLDMKGIWSPDLWVGRPKHYHWATKPLYKEYINIKVWIINQMGQEIPVLANLSQLPPLCATWDLYEANCNLFTQLLSLYDMGVVWCSLFENILFWLYFWDPCMNFNTFCDQIVHFFARYFPFTWFFCTIGKTQEKKFL